MRDEELKTMAEKLAPILIECVRKNKHEFWIDPEDHYNAHRDNERIHNLFSEDDFSSIKSLIKLYTITTGLFVKSFIGLAVLGALVLAFFGLFWKK